MKTAVTLEAPAVSSMEEALETGFLPEDPNYRLTGKFSAEKPNSAAFSEKKEGEKKDDKQDASTGAAGAGDDKTAAGSEPAPSQEQTEEQENEEEGREAAAAAPGQKTAQKSESRWHKVTRENKELREKNARLEAAAKAAPTRETEQAPQPAKAAAAAKTEGAVPKPKIDDVDPKTGKPKYATYKDFEDAKDEWLGNDAVRRFQESTARTAKDTRLQQAKETITREWTNRVVKAREKYADFDAIALDTKHPLKEGSVPDVFILDSDFGTDILYHLGKNPGELERINQLNPVAQARELTKIELKVSGGDSEKKPAPGKKITQAPPPANQVSGRGTVAKDAVEQAVEEGDSETYIREQNARDLARLKRK